MHKRISTILLVLAIVGGHANGVAQGKSSGRVRQARLRVLVDSIHAHSVLEPLTEATRYNYHHIYGMRRAFQYLRSRGVQVDEVSSGRLERGRLAPYGMLFIGLVSGDLPPFLVSEIRAIKGYVRSGGGLMVITDHSNAYYHAYKLMPLLEELGIKAATETACERPPATLGESNIWITITRFTHHPVTQGLRTIAMLAGGTVDGRYAVAATSKKSWGDQWQIQPYGEDSQPWFIGNRRRDSGERSGPLGVVLAKRFGRGRIVIVADQNILGDPFINYADNYRLWLNAVAWLAGDHRLADPQPYLQWHRPRVLAYERYAEAVFGDGGNNGYYNLFVMMAQRLSIFASEDLSGKPDLIVFAHDALTLSKDAMAGVIRHLRSGKNVVVLGRLTQRSASIPDLISRIEARLGPAEVEGDSATQSYGWPGCGRVILLPDNEMFRNNSLSGGRPGKEQQLWLDTFIQLLRDVSQSPAADAAQARSAVK